MCAWTCASAPGESFRCMNCSNNSSLRQLNLASSVAKGAFHLVDQLATVAWSREKEGMALTFASLFLQHWRGANEGVDLAELDAALVDFVGAAKKTWPAAKVTPEFFVRYVAERTSKEESPAASLAALHGSDLLLAC